MRKGSSSAQRKALRNNAVADFKYWAKHRSARGPEATELLEFVVRQHKIDKRLSQRLKPVRETT